MKSRKIILIVFLAVASIIGLATLQENIFVENQIININEFSSKEKTITVSLTDGIGFGDNG